MYYLMYAYEIREERVRSPDNKVVQVLCTVIVEFYKRGTIDCFGSDRLDHSGEPTFCLSSRARSSAGHGEVGAGDDVDREWTVAVVDLPATVGRF